MLSLLLPGCPNIDTNTGSAIVAGPQGGIFVREGFVMEIPRGALSNEVRIVVSITDINIPTVPMRTRISYGYRFSPKDLRFSSPMKLFLPWIQAKVPQAVSEDSFDMLRNRSAAHYEALPGTKTTLSPFQAVEAWSDRLGLFWLTSPSQPNIDRLELSPKEATIPVGQTQQYVAKIIAPNGEAIAVPVEWSIAPPRIGTIDAQGLVTTAQPGTATVTARTGTHAAQAKALVQGNTEGPEKFVHINPFPTGNDLYTGMLDFNGQGTLFAGANGTLLLRDAQKHWKPLYSVPGITIKAIAGSTRTHFAAVGRTATGAGALLQFRGDPMEATSTIFPAVEISDLVALWFDGTHGMGVGSGNDVVIYRNETWETEFHPSVEALLATIGNGQGSFLVVGNLGSLYAWNPQRKVWNSLTDARLKTKLEAALFVRFAPAEAWAVSGDRLWHFQNNAWQHESLPAQNFEKITALGMFDNRIAVGGQKKAATSSLGIVSVRSTNAGATTPQWASFELRNIQVPRGIVGGGFASKTGYAVGDFGAIWQWNTTTSSFEERSSGFYGDIADLAVADGEVFAAVNTCIDIHCTGKQSQIRHRGSDGVWNSIAQFPARDQIVYAIETRTASEVVVSSPSALWHWNGNTWTKVPVHSDVLETMDSDVPATLVDLKYCGDTLWGAGSNGATYTGTPKGMRSYAILSKRALTQIHCPSASEIWVVGDQLLAVRRDKTGFRQHMSDTINQAPWRVVWSPGSGEAYVFGDAYYGVYWDTQALRLIESTASLRIDVANGLWGSSPDNLYMVGLARQPAPIGFALRFNGAQWRVVDLGAHRAGTCMVGSAKGDIWVGTKGGGILKGAMRQ